MALILIVDDDKDVRETVAATLQLENHVTLEAPNGSAALQMIQAQPVDLVVTDMFMPQLGGGEVIGRIRDEFPHVKIIAISGSSSALRATAASAGDGLNSLSADARLAKPFHRRELIETVTHVLGAA